MWRQRLSVALQQERFRVMRNKVAAALGGPMWQPWGEDVEGIPGLPWREDLSGRW